MKNSFSISQAISFGWTTFKSRWRFWLIVFILVFGSAGSSGSSSSSSSSKSVNKTTQVVSSMLAVNTNNEPNVLGLTAQNKQDSLVADPADGITIPPTAVPIPETDSNPLGALLVLGPLLAIAIPYLIFVIVLAVGYVILAMAVSIIIQMGFTHLAIDAVRGNPLEYKTLLSDVSVRKALRVLLLGLIQLFIIIVGTLFFIIPGLYFATRFMFASQLMIDKNLSIGEALSQSGQLTKGVKLKLLGMIFVFLFIMILSLFAFLFGIIPAIMALQLATMHVYVTLEKQTFGQTSEQPATQPTMPMAESLAI